MSPEQGYRVRPAREGDREQLFRLWRTFLDEQARLDPRFVVADDAGERWGNDFPEWIGAHVHGLFVAVCEEDLIGFASVHLWFPAPIYTQELEVYLNEIFVSDGWRRRGVARSLLEEVCRWAGERKARRIRLGVLSTNADALAFWRATGAEPFVETMVIDL